MSANEKFDRIRNFLAELRRFSRSSLLLYITVNKYIACCSLYSNLKSSNLLHCSQYRQYYLIFRCDVLRLSCLYKGYVWIHAFFINNDHFQLQLQCRPHFHLKRCLFLPIFSQILPKIAYYWQFSPKAFSFFQSELALF